MKDKADDLLLQALDSEWRTPRQLAKKAGLYLANARLSKLYELGKAERRTVNNGYEYRAKQG